jgi:predicted unusual protein kinase regulating ubiquinone biosynthesis (AarF/ABC1/UbiB family)
MVAGLAESDAAGTALAAVAPALPQPPAGRVLWRLLVVHAIFWFYASVWFLDLLRVRWFFWVVTLRRNRYERVTFPVALRLAFEKLGPTYVKLGQLIASGEALFPPRYSAEFQKCLDRVPAFSFDDVKATLLEDLGEEGMARFRSIDEKPMAAASIAQVHAAMLESGEEVVIKVQRPRLVELVSTDVVLMRWIARGLAFLFKRARESGAVGIVDDFATNLAEELNFQNEMRCMQRFNRVMHVMGTESVTAPKSYVELSGPRVLTMERFRGWSVADTAAVRASGFDGEERLLTGIRAWFQCLLVADFFHGDVHGGNFMLLEDGRIGFLDFGIVGRLLPSTKNNVLEYVMAFQSRDFQRLGDAMIAIGATGKKLDRERFIRDLKELYAPMFDPVEGFRMADLVPNMMRVAARHQLKLPRDLVLISKQLVYLDRYSRALGGNKMNVLTDERIRDLIMQDMLAATVARQAADG